MTTPRLPTTATHLLDDRPPVDDSQSTTMPTRELPHTAAAFAEDGTGQTTINDDDPRTALELIRDAIVLFERGMQTTTLQRGSYEVIITQAPETWRESAEYAVHLDCVTDHITPDPNEPGVSARSATNLWSVSLTTVREIVRDHFGTDVFEQFTQEEEEC